MYSGGMWMLPEEKRPRRRGGFQVARLRSPQVQDSDSRSRHRGPLPYGTAAKPAAPTDSDQLSLNVKKK